MNAFYELMMKAQARGGYQVGLAEQEAALVAVGVMGWRYPDLLLGPALAGIRSIDRHYAPADKANSSLCPWCFGDWKAWSKSVGLL